MLHFEDFEIGLRHRFGPRRVEAGEMVEFAHRYDPQDFHLDRAAAVAGPFGALAASGWLTCGVVMQLLVTGFIRDSAWLGSPGISDLRWPRPLIEGTEVTALSTVIDRRVSKSRPDRGLVTFEWSALAPDEAVLMSMQVIGILKRRQPGAVPATDVAELDAT
jgi:acyl dehydratase